MAQRAALALAALLTASVTAAGAPVTVPIVKWQLALPNEAFEDLPALLPEVDFAPSNDLQYLAFVCEGERFYALIVAPAFEHEAQASATLTLGPRGPGLTLALRDLYAAPGPDAPKLDWDADLLYAPVEMEDISEMGSVKSLALALPGHDWLLPMTGFAAAMPVFLEYCATGKVSDRSVVRP